MDAWLVNRVLEGDSSAFDQIVWRYYGLIYTIAYARLGARETAEDLTQEVFLRVYLHLDSFDRRRPLAPWLSRIARNLAINWAKSGCRHSSLVLNLPEEALERLPTLQEDRRQKMERDEQAELLRVMLMRLPEDEREVVLLHYMEELSKKEIAERLGVHPSTVGRQIDRGLKRLKSELEPMLKEVRPSLSKRRLGVVRALGIVGAAAALGGEAKAALVGASGGLKALAAQSSLASVGMPQLNLLAPLGFWLARLLALTAAGGVTIYGVDQARHSNSFQWLLGGSGQATIPRPASPSAGLDAQYASQILAVRAAFTNVQGYARTGDLQGLTNCYDLKSWQILTGLDEAGLRRWLSQGQAGMARLLAGVKVERVWVESTEWQVLEVEYPNGRPMRTITLEPPLISVKAGDWQGRFVLRGTRWLLFDQQISGDALPKDGVLHEIEIQPLD